MIVTEILGNVHDDAGAALVGDRHREQVHLEGSALVKRIQRLRTDHGNEYGLRLPAGSPDLRDGDILTVDDEGERGNAVIVVPSRMRSVRAASAPSSTQASDTGTVVGSTSQCGAGVADGLEVAE